MATWDTPMHFAARLPISTGSIELIELMLELGARVDIQNRLDDSPLHDVSAFRMLLSFSHKLIRRPLSAVVVWFDCWPTSTLACRCSI